MKKQNKIYVVFKGRKPGIYATWAEAEKQVVGYSGAVHRSYQEMYLAKSAFESGDPNFAVEGGDRNVDLAIQAEESKCYSVFVGHKVGVFSTLQEAEEQIELYPDGYYDVYTSHQEAIEALECFFIGVPIESSVSINGQYLTDKISNL